MDTERPPLLPFALMAPSCRSCLSFGVNLVVALSRTSYRLIPKGIPMQFNQEPGWTQEFGPFDNFDAHVSNEGYRVVNKELGSHLCAIPPNATSVCQPLDVGIMASFKKHLRNLWLKETLVEGEENDDDDDEDNLTARTKRLVIIKRAIKARDMIMAEEIRASFMKAIPVQNS
ncbi:hypothetical protein LEN26_004027 [Aphanomyces euteiches]|nr:hypothetical protein AeMF1_017059 [Aphanomyces euteiches]KAH9148109.1 hypothetical protein LEN26_004604 [Aphanomyces euteiches]KAH9150724.1 hypothetical protein LEN26_004027 [Aphanomyces euteiches]KAH9191812.1 hypothetical protein AeNC1_006215 [Aphanomyces euteiches]